MQAGNDISKAIDVNVQDLKRKNNKLLIQNFKKAYYNLSKSREMRES